MITHCLVQPDPDGRQAAHEEDGMSNAEFCCTAPKKKAEQRRDRVIEAARKLFIDKGFHGTGIAQIAKDSGIAVGQLYRDFSAKEDIVAAIVNGDCCSFMAAIRPCVIVV